MEDPQTLTGNCSPLDDYLLRARTLLSAQVLHGYPIEGSMITSFFSMVVHLFNVILTELFKEIHDAGDSLGLGFPLQQ